MNIIKNKEADVLNIKVEGRLDTVTSPELEASLGEESLGTKVVFDMSDLEYISSAGLRVLLSAQKKAIAEGGEMIVKGCQEAVLDVFDVTGFADILTIEK